MQNLTPNPDLRPPEMRKTTYFRKWVSRLDYMRSATKEKKFFPPRSPPFPGVRKAERKADRFL